MGSLCTTSISPTVAHNTTLTNTTIPEWTSQGGQQLFENAKNLAFQPYQPFPSPRLSDFNADQLSAFDTVRGNVGAWQPMFDEGRNLITSGSGAWTDPGVADEYMNPYINDVVNATIGDINRTFDMSAIGEDANAAKWGALGGGRHGVMAAESLRNRADTIGKASSNLRAQGYEAGRTAFENDQRRALSGGNQLIQGSGALSGLLGSDAAALEAIGSTQQQRADQNLSLGYQDFLRQQQHPYQQLNFALGALKGIPYSQTSTSTSAAEQLFQNPSILGQGIGALGALYAGSRLFS